MSETAIVEKQNKWPKFFYMHAKKLYYPESFLTVEEGGHVLVKCGPRSSLPKVSLEEFRAMMASQSDRVWAPHLRPSNLLFVKVVEGIAPFCVVDVDGYDQSRKLMLLPPLEVLGRVLPKLYEEAAADPKGSGCGSIDPADFAGKSTDHINKMISENKARLEALKWTLSDCQADRGNGVRSARPNMANNKWNCLSPSDTATWMQHFKPLVDNLRPTKSQLATGKEKKSTDEATRIFPGLQIADVSKMMGNQTAELAITCNAHETVSFEKQGNTYFVRMFDSQKKRSREEFEKENETVAAPDEDGDVA